MNQFKSTCILILVIFFTACTNQVLKSVPAERDYEIEVINDILPILIFDVNPSIVVPVKGEESDAEFETREKEYQHLKDSIGRKVIVFPRLVKFDDEIFNIKSKSKELKDLIFKENCPKTDRMIDSSMIQSIGSLHISVSTDQAFDSFTLGHFSFSRVAFNGDYTRAVLYCTIYDGTCTPEFVFLQVRFEKEKWQIFKRIVL